MECPDTKEGKGSKNTSKSLDCLSMKFLWKTARFMWAESAETVHTLLNCADIYVKFNYRFQSTPKTFTDDIPKTSFP